MRRRGGGRATHWTVMLSGCTTRVSGCKPRAAVWRASPNAKVSSRPQPHAPVATGSGGGPAGSGAMPAPPRGSAPGTLHGASWGPHSCHSCQRPSAAAISAWHCMSLSARTAPRRGQSLQAHRPPRQRCPGHAAPLQPPRTVTGYSVPSSRSTRPRRLWKRTLPGERGPDGAQGPGSSSWVLSSRNAHTCIAFCRSPAMECASCQPRAAAQPGAMAVLRARAEALQAPPGQSSRSGGSEYNRRACGTMRALRAPPPGGPPTGAAALAAAAAAPLASSRCLRCVPRRCHCRCRWRCCWPQPLQSLPPRRPRRPPP